MTAPSSPPTDRRVSAALFLLGIGVCLYVLHHLVPLTTRDYDPRVNGVFVDVLWVGTDAMLVGLGCLLVQLGRSRSALAWTGQLARRYLPLHVLVVGAATVATLVATDRSAAATGDILRAGPWLWPWAIDLRADLYNNAFLRGAIFSLRPLWIPAIALHFSLLLVPMVRWAPRRVAAVVVVALALVSTLARAYFVRHGGGYFTAYAFVAFRFESVGIGALIALVPDEWRGRARSAAVPFLIAAALLVALWLTTGLNRHDLRVEIIGYPLVDYFWGALLWALLVDERVRLPWLGAVGRRAFSVLLLHAWLQPLVELGDHALVRKWHLQTAAHYVVHATLLIAVAVALVLATWRWCDPGATRRSSAADRS